MSNLRTYEKKKTVGEYTNYFSYLFKPELKFIRMYAKDLAEMKMLDLGVGGGRTTEHFAKLVKSYTAVDYATHMIEACKIRFKDNPQYKFLHCDVRDLKAFRDDEFDFVLFSYNGLDYISHEQRVSVINELYRIAKNDGHFVFSSHNLQSIKRLYEIEFTFKPVTLIKRVLKYFLITYFNGPLNRYSSKDYAIINDGAHNFGLKTYYVKPSVQIEFLVSCGFVDIKLFSIDDGEERTNYQDIDDDWIYYFCTVSK